MKSLILISIMLCGGLLGSIPHDVEIKVGIGQTENFGSTGLKFLEVLEDSRCPDGANCIWAGRAKIRVEFVDENGGKVRAELVTNGEENSIEYKNCRITLKTLVPHPKSGSSLENSEYEATFVISKAG